MKTIKWWLYRLICWSLGVRGIGYVTPEYAAKVLDGDDVLMFAWRVDEVKEQK